MSMNDLAQALMYLFAMLFALTFHEAAHALAARLEGDNTAKLAGRLTLDPTAHIDLVGTIILPFVGALLHMPLIGWAKPVPIDSRYFKHRRFGPFIVAFAGPLANLVMCFLGVLLLSLYIVHGAALIPEGSFLYPLIRLLSAIVMVNAILAFFNLIPLPPLDGAAVLTAYLPYEWGRAYEQYVAPYGFMIVLLLAMSGGLNWISGVAQVYIGLCQIVVSMLL